MSSTYEAKEMARLALFDALDVYMRAAENYELDDKAMASEIESILYDLGKQWDIFTE